MSGGAKFGIGLVLGLVFGGAAGGFGGAHVGARGVAANWASADANNVSDCIGLLKVLRGKEHEVALAGMEEHLNRHLVGVMPANLEQFNLHKKPLFRKVRLRAKGYREANPQKLESGLSKSVATMLSEEKE
jgi:hypothetical protein